MRKSKISLVHENIANLGNEIREFLLLDDVMKRIVKIEHLKLFTDPVLLSNVQNNNKRL